MKLICPQVYRRSCLPLAQIAMWCTYRWSRYHRVGGPNRPRRRSLVSSRRITADLSASLCTSTEERNEVQLNISVASPCMGGSLTSARCLRGGQNQRNVTIFWEKTRRRRRRFWLYISACVCVWPYSQNKFVRGPHRREKGEPAQKRQVYSPFFSLRKRKDGYFYFFFLENI